MPDVDAPQLPDNQDDWTIEVRPRNLEDLSKLVAAVALACYVLGLLTVNTYLYGLGVSDFALFRARFVLVGAAVLVPILIALVWFTIAKLLYQISQERLAWRQNVAILAMAALTLGTTLFTILILSRWLTSDLAAHPSRFGIPVAYWLVAAGLGIVVSSSAALSLSTRPDRAFVLRDGLVQHSNKHPGTTSSGPSSIRRPQSHPTASQSGDDGRRPRSDSERRSAATALRLTRGPALVLLLVSVFVSFVLYLLLFAEIAFPLIPEQFGGGKPRQAHLLVSAASIGDAQALGLSVTESNPVSPPVRVLWESEEALVITPPGQTNADTIIRINKALVSAVIMDMSPATPVATSSVRVE
jgi:hypothetical protein